MSLNKMNASWKRRQDYLFKSLFQDLPPFSPAPEESETANSIRIQPPSVAPESSHRPFSLSPPLMMEVKQNRHDETDDDLDEEDAADENETDINDTTRSSSDVLPKSSSNEDGDTDSLSSSVPDGADAEEVNAVTCDTPTSEHSMDYRRVTFQADVHKAADHIVPPPSVLCELVAEGTETDTHIGGDNQDILLENRYVPDNIDIIPELDVMRTPQIEHNEHSRNRKRSSSSSSSSKSKRPRYEEAGTQTSVDRDNRTFSPAPEESETANSIRIQPPSVAPESSHRPFSLSPPLMMEVKQNRHDETDDDLDEEDAADENETDINDTTRSSSDVLPKSSSNEDGDTDSLSSSVPDGADAEEVNAVTCDTPTSEHSMDYRRVTFQADVHKAADHIVPPPSVLCELVAEGTETDTHIGGDNQDILLENRYVPDNIDIIPELDVMRTPQIEHNEHSRNRKRSSSSSSSSKSKRPRYEEAGTQTSVDRDNRTFSPAPEESETANSIRIQPPSVAPESSHRPFSLSPPLMMEVKQNRHDETDDDLDEEDAADENETDINDTTRSSSDVLPKSSSNEDGDTDSLSSSVPDGADAEEVNAVTCDTPTSEHSMDYRRVTFQADVHKAADHIVPPPSVLCELVAEGTETDTHIGGDNQDILLENRYVPDNIDIIPELDVMRTPQIEHNEHSRNRKRSSSSSSSSKSKRPRYEEAGTQTSVDRDNRTFAPAPEESESANSSHIQPPSVAPESSHRPFSLSPPLMMEVKPNRHDETDDDLDEEDAADENETDINDTTRSSSDVLPKSSSNEDGDTDSLSSSVPDGADAEEVNAVTCDTPTSEHSMDYRLVTLQGDELVAEGTKADTDIGGDNQDILLENRYVPDNIDIIPELDVMRTPQIEHNEHSRNRKRSSSSSSSSKSKRPRYEEAGTQTSVDRDNRSNFPYVFVGRTLRYKICTCADHVCSSTRR